MIRLVLVVPLASLPVGDPVDVAPGPMTFEVNAAESKLPQTGGSIGSSNKSEAVLPPCNTVDLGVECAPVTICEPDPSMGGTHALHSYVGVPIHGWDYGVTGRCEPSEAEARPSLPALVLRAFERVPLPEPRLSIQPPKGRTLVGLETIFSTQAEPFTRTLTLLGRQVELRITPSRFHWLHDDSTTQTTDWPGKPWDSDQPDIDGYVTHLYEHTGTVRPGVEVTWSAQYRVGNGPWQDVDGTVTRTSPRAELQVLEGEPVLHGY